MARVLTGIQSSGKPHLGNILGAIKPAIELAKDPNNEALFFIANMHSSLLAACLSLALPVLSLYSSCTSLVPGIGGCGFSLLV